MNAFDPTKPRLHYFDAPNPHGVPGTHKIAFYEWGSPYSPVIFCVHGLTRNARDFDFLASHLANRYRIICVDVAGRGKSANMQDLSWYENGVYMQDILALAEWMNIPQFDWIGTSMGGIIGMMIASLVPGKIIRLVLNDIGAQIPAEGLLRIGEYVGQSPALTHWDQADQYLRKIFAPFGIKNEAHWQHMFDHSLIRHANGNFTFAYDANIGEAFRLAASAMEKIEDISLWMLWEAVTCPVLILRGAVSDILPRATAEKMCDMHKNATLIEFTGIGHAPTLFEPEQIEAVSKWLDATT